MLPVTLRHLSIQLIVNEYEQFLSSSSPLNERRWERVRLVNSINCFFFLFLNARNHDLVQWQSETHQGKNTRPLPSLLISHQQLEIVREQERKHIHHPQHSRMPNNNSCLNIKWPIFAFPLAELFLNLFDFVVFHRNGLEASSRQRSHHQSTHIQSDCWLFKSVVVLREYQYTEVWVIQFLHI